MVACFVLVAGEASGDRLGAAIIEAVRAKRPDARFIGVPGPLMRQAGCEAWFGQEDLAVMGVVDVIRHLPLILKRRKQLLRAVADLKPTAYIGLDAPDFNLPIERRLKAQGIKTVHVNSPTVWAWRRGRLKSIGQSVDLMLLLFPFEQAIYERAGIAAVYIGHPLADLLPLDNAKASARDALGVATNAKVLALLPGSRASELRYMAATFIKVTEKCQQSLPDLLCYVPLLNERSRHDFISYWQAEAPHLPLHCTIGNAHTVMQAADVVLVTSGTATLEAMLCQTPMVVAYRMHPLNYAIAKCLINTPHIALPNILAGERLVPERIQQAASVHQLSTDVLHWFHNSEQSQHTISRFRDIHQTLRCHAAETAAEAILALGIGH